MIFFISLWPLLSFAQVNINTATLEELDTLPEVGPAIAQRIINARPFSSIEDIMRVSGIATTTFEKMKPYITISGETKVDLPEDSKTENTSGSTSKNITNVTQAKIAEAKVTGFSIDIPDYAYVNQWIEFDANPTSGRATQSMRHTWNFGDGTSQRLGKPTHYYRYAGKYVVVVEVDYQKGTFLSRKEIEILPFSLAVVNFDNQVTVTNNGDREIDLFNMKIKRGLTEFIFPKYSILLPQSSVTVSVEGNSDAVLYDQMGYVVTRPITQAGVSEFVSRKYTAGKVLGDSATEDRKADEVVEEKSGAGEARTTEDQQSRAQPNKFKENWTYLAFLGVIALGLFAVFMK